MQDTYNVAMTKVLADEGGYSNDVGDPGGPTNFGITIHDARMYWKADASASDVRHMPKDVALLIYKRHYATPVHYDELPPGVDYSVFDYGINSGIGRAIPKLQGFVHAKVDGKIGTETLGKVYGVDAEHLIDQIWAERLHFLQGLANWRRFGKGWGTRCRTGRALAHKLFTDYHMLWHPPQIAPTEHPGQEATPTQVAMGAKAYEVA